MTLKTEVTVDKNSDCITELNYFKVYIYIYIYIYITSDMEKSKNSSHERYRTSGHKTNGH